MIRCIKSFGSGSLRPVPESEMPFSDVMRFVSDLFEIFRHKRHIRRQKLIQAVLSYIIESCFFVISSRHNLPTRRRTFCGSVMIFNKSTSPPHRHQIWKLVAQIIIRPGQITLSVVVTKHENDVWWLLTFSITRIVINKKLKITSQFSSSVSWTGDRALHQMKLHLTIHFDLINFCRFVDLLNLQSYC